MRRLAVDRCTEPTTIRVRGWVHELDCRAAIVCARCEACEQHCHCGAPVDPEALDTDPSLDERNEHDDRLDGSR